MRIKFPVTVEKDEDGFIVASCPSLPGCHTQGRDTSEALDNIKDAIQIHLEFTGDIPEEILDPIPGQTDVDVEIIN